MRKIIIKEGLLWNDKFGPKENIIGTIEADKISRANGLIYAEHFVKEFDGETVYLNEELKIVEPYSEMSTERLQRKLDQAYEMAGLARQGRDTKNEEEHMNNVKLIKEELATR